MMKHLFSSLGAGLAPALANHLWQSTVFAAAVALLTLLLRKNYAQVRYRLWLAASVKFLVPFSLLIGLGSHLPKPYITLEPQIAMYSAFDVAGQPFTEFAKPIMAHHSAAPKPLKSLLTARLPILLALAWLCGVVTVVLVWYVRWLQVAAIRRRSLSVAQGREAAILRQLEGDAHAGTCIPLLQSQDLLEPGIFGIVHPVLLWPERLSDHLDDDHIEAILTHELMHVRRHDNLTAALHMLVEALFWFHPMVWWIEARMVEERELGCDEAVLQSGGNPDAYAEGLLKACRFCVESPLACVSGISGADLSKRILRIMDRRASRRMAFSSRLLLMLTALVALATPIVFGQVDAALHSSLPLARPPIPPPPPPPRGYVATGLHP